MAFKLSQSELEKELNSIIATGVLGNGKDFFSWVSMEIKRKFKDLPDCTQEQVSAYLEDLKSKGQIISGKFDEREYIIADNSPLEKKLINSDSYSMLGAGTFSPLQFVRSRLEYFLKRNGVSEEQILDISIGTTEAVENTVKYGDGDLVEVKYSLDKSKVFRISILNQVGEMNLQSDIERGKFSSTATLMRGMMVMQKLFDTMDLDIIDEKKQALFTAEKKLP